MGNLRVHNVAAKISDRYDNTYFNEAAEQEIEAYFANITKESIIDRLCSTSYIAVTDLGLVTVAKNTTDNTFLA